MTTQGCNPPFARNQMTKPQTGSFLIRVSVRRDSDHRPFCKPGHFRVPFRGYVLEQAALREPGLPVRLDRAEQDRSVPVIRDREHLSGFDPSQLDPPSIIRFNCFHGGYIPQWTRDFKRDGRFSTISPCQCPSMERRLWANYAVRGDPFYGERIQYAGFGSRTRLRSEASARQARTTRRTSTRTSSGRGPELPTVRGDVNFGILILE